MEEIISVIILLFSLIVSAFFSGSETALFSFPREKLQSIKKSQFTKSNIIDILENNPTGILSTILFGNLVVNIIFFCISASICYRFNIVYNNEKSILIGIITLFLIIIFGEVIPKAIGLKYSKKIIFFTSPFLIFSYKIFKPIRKIIDILINKMTLNQTDDLKFSRDELKTLIDSTASDQNFGSQEKEIIEEIFSLSSIRVRELMIPRVEIDYFNADWTVEECINKIKGINLDFLPIYSEKKENIIGFVEFSNLFVHKKSSKISELLESIIFVPENKTADHMLQQFFKENLSLVGVVDEFGGLAGIISKNILLKKIIGGSNIKDNPSIKVIDIDTYLLKGNLNIREWEELFVGFIPKEYLNLLDLDTLGGLVISILKKMPSEGDKAYLGNLCFIVDKINDHRIEYIKLKLLSNEGFRDE